MSIILRTPRTVSAAHGAQLAGSSAYHIRRHALLGHIRILAEPGVAMKFSREDCERLARDRREVSTQASTPDIFPPSE